MSSVDDRLVSMKFDNKQFLEGIKTTLASLKSLNEGLKLKVSTVNLDKVKTTVTDLGHKVGSIDLSKLGNDVSIIASRFNNLGIVGVTVLQNISNRAIAAGEQLLKSFTVDPIKTGFQEYETQINSVQTILANTQSKGTGLNDVNAALDELNKYADQTIYNFTEMTRNIGTFTAAGVDLDTSVAAIKGIANLAAVSGSTSQQASTAMYQLSQAMASGTVKLMDWNSVVNAGMGGQVFQDSLKETARVHGVAIDDMIEAEGSFRETLKSGWLTTEVLTETLSKFTGDLSAEQLKSMGYTEEQAEAILKMGVTANDAATKVKTFTQLMDTLKEAAQSGWTQSWEILIGDFEEAKGLLTELSEVFSGVLNATSEARNSVLLAWKDGGGRDLLIDSMRNSLAALNSVVAPLKGAFESIFPPITAETLIHLTENLKNFTQSLILSGETSENVQTIFSGIFSVVKLITDAILETAKAFAKLISKATPIAEELLYPLADMSTVVMGIVAWIRKLVDNFKQMESAKNLFNSIANIFNRLKSVVTNVYGSVKSLASGLSDKTFDASALIFSKMAEAIDFVAWVLNEAVVNATNFIDSLKDLPIIQETVSKMSEVFDTLRTNVFNVSSTIKSNFISAFQNVSSKVREFATGLKDLITQLTGVSSASDAFSKIQTFISDVLEKGLTVFDNVKESVTSVIDNIKQFGSIQFDNISSGLNGLQEKINNIISSAQKLPNIGDVFGNAKEGMAAFGETTTNVASTVRNEFTELVKWLKEKIGNLTLGDVIAAGTSGSMIAFFLSMSKMSDSASRAVDSFTKVANGFANIVPNINNTLTSIANSYKAKANATKYEAISGIIKSVVLLAGALAVLATLDQEKLKTSAIVVGVLAATIVGLAAAMAFISDKIKGEKLAETTGLIVTLAGSLVILGVALRIISGIESDKLGASVVAIGVVMAEFAALMLAMSKIKEEAAVGVTSIIAMSFSLILLSKAMEMISGLGVSKVAGSLSVIAILSVFLVAVTKLVKNKKSLKAVKGIAVIAASILIMALALKAIASIDNDSIISAIGRLIVIVGLVAVLMIASKHAGKHAMKGGAAIILISAALIIITEAINRMAALDSSALSQASNVVLGILAIFALITLMTKFAGENATKAGMAITLMSGSMLLLALAMAVMTKLDPDGLDRARNAVMGILAMFGLLVASTKFSKDAETTIRNMTVALAILAGSLIILSLVNPDGLKSATIALDSLILCFSILVAATGLVQKSVGTLAMLMLVVISLGAILYKLSELPVEGLLASSISLSAVILAFSASLAILQFVDPALALKGIGALAIMVGGMVMLIGALGYLNQNIEGLQGLVDSGIPLLAAIGKGIGDFLGNLIGGVLGGITSGLLAGIGKGLSSFMTEIQVFLEGLKGIDQTMVDNAVRLTQIMLLFAAADFVAGLAAFGGNSAIQSFAEKLPLLGLGMTLFAAATAGIDSGRLQPALDALIVLTNLLNTLGNSGGLLGEVLGDKINSLVGLIEQMKPLGEGLKDFQSAVSGIGTDGIAIAMNAFSLIVNAFNSLNNSGGLGGVLVGDQLNTLEGIIPKLASLGVGLRLFQASVAGIQTDGIDTAFDILGRMSSFFNGLNTSGGLGGVLAGDQLNSLQGIANHLQTMGGKIMAFQQSVAGLSTDGIEPAFNILGKMSSFFNGLDVSGGLGSILAGDQLNTMTNLISQLGEDGLGSKLKTFQEEVSGISSEGVEPAFSVLTSLMNFFNGLESSGGAGAIFAGDKLATFKGVMQNIGWIGESIKNVVNATADDDSGDRVAKIDALVKSVNAIKVLFGAISGLQSSGGWGGILGGDVLSTIRDGLPALGDAFEKFNNKVNAVQIDTSRLNTAVNSLRTLTDFYKMVEKVDYSKVDTLIESYRKLQTNISNFESVDTSGLRSISTAMQSIGRSIGSGASSINTSINKMISDAARLAISKTSNNGDFQKAGKNLVASLGLGMRNGIAPLSIIMKAIVVSAKSGIGRNSLYSAGTQLCAGLARGIRDGRSSVVNAASAVAAAAVKAAKATLKIKSPSRVFMEIGGYASEGMAIGISNMADRVKAASEEVSQKAVDSAQDVVSKVYSSLDDGLNYEPTITPVIDASQITSGVNGINSKLGGLSANLGLQGANLSASFRNIDLNSDSAKMDKLVKAIGKMTSAPGTTYNNYMNGITYDDGTNIANAIQTIAHEIKMTDRS